MRNEETATTLVDLFERSIRTFERRDLFGTKIGGKWVFVSYGQVKKLVDDLRAGLASLGVGAQDRVAIISNNRVEWPIAAYATYGLGAAFVPMYESQLERDWEFILRDSAAKVLFVSDASVYRRVEPLVRRIGESLKHVIVLSNEDGATSYSTLLVRGAHSPVGLSPVSPDDLATLLYTSGTTGDPKGVMLSHRNVVANVRAVEHAFPVDERDRTLAFLPWAHAFGHTAELHLFLSIGASLAICESADRILSNLAEVRPSVLVAVPRVFSRLYGAVQRQMRDKAAPVRVLFNEGIACALRKRRGEKLSRWEEVKLALADKLIFAKVRARLGGKLRFAVSGAAALAREVAEFVDALGIEVYEGYGLTEASPIVTVNTPEHRKTGSVGRPIAGVRIAIDTNCLGIDAQGGEIIVYGANVMQGYHNHLEATRAAFTEDGGLRTGDMGHIDEQGFLFVTGRIKEQYKLENGKYVAPAPLEEALRLSPFIANVMVHGENRPFNVALVVPNLQPLQEWSRAKGLALGTASGSAENLAESEPVRAKIAAEIEKYSTDFKSYEKVRRFVLIFEDFTQENDMLTPSLKLKRRNVLRRYQSRIGELYGSRELPGPKAAEGM